MSGDPDRLPSLTRLGERLGAAAEREIAAQRRGRRFRRRRPFVLLGIAGALVLAGGVSATDVFTGSGDPVPGEPGAESAQPGVLADSAAADPAPGALPWAIRVFSDEGRQCFQLGRLSEGRLGTVESGQFRPYAGSPVGPCGDLEKDGLLISYQSRVQPAPRTIAYGISSGRGPVTIDVDGQRRVIEPGALGGFVVVFEGSRDRMTVKATTEVNGRRIVQPPDR